MTITARDRCVSLSHLAFLALALLVVPLPALGQSPELVAEQTSEIFLDKDGSGGITAGDLIEYEVVITNIGTGSDLDVVFDETIANGASLEAGSVVVTGGDVSIGNNDEDPQVVVELEGLASAETITVTFQARVDNVQIPTAVDVLNQGVVTSAIGHPGGIGTDDPTTVPVGDATVTDLKRPDLSVVSSDLGGAMAPGDLLVYEVIYANVGNAHAEASEVVETVPLDTTFVAAESSAGWDCPDGSRGGTVCSFDIGFLDIGSSGSLDFAVRVSETATQSTQIINVAAIGDDGSHGADEEASDNLHILVTGIGTDLDLGLGVTPLLDPVMAGAIQVYEFTVSNAGPLAATEVTLDYDLPEGVEYLASNLGEPACLEDAGTVTCAVSDLGVDETQSIFVTARIDPLFTGTLDGSATVSSAETDSSLADNTVTIAEQLDPFMVTDSVSDTNGNGVDEIVILAYEDGLARVRVNDGETEELLANFSLADGFIPVDLEVLPNYAGTDADELVVVAKDPVSGASRLFVRDAGDGQLLRQRSLLAAFHPVDIEIVPDMNASGVDEVAVLEIDPVAGVRQITIKDADASPTLETVDLGTSVMPIELERTSDGRLAVLGVVAADGSSRVSLYDELDGSDLGELDFPAGWTPSEFEVVADLDDNGAEEFAVLLRQSVTAKTRVFVTDSVSGAEVRMAFDDTMVARDLEVVASVGGSSAEELVVALRSPDGSDQRIWVKDAGTGRVFRQIYHNPDRVAHDIGLIASYGGTDADEIIIAGTDGEIEIRVKDAKTAKNLATYKPF